MIDTDPVILIRDMLQANWDVSNTDLSEQPRIHTGWYDYDAGTPQVTVTNPNEFVVNGGLTGISAGGNDKPVQRKAGTVLVNGWSGTREKLKGEGPNGDDINPKKMSHQLGKEINRVMLSNTTNVVNSIAPDSVQGSVEDEGPEIVFRHEVTVRYTYVED